MRSEEGTDLQVLQNEFLYEAIMDGQNRWQDAFQQGGEDQVSSQRETGFDLVSDTNLNGDITTASTSIIVDASDDFDTSDGAVIIWDDAIPDYINYTTNTIATETLSGVTGIAFAHEDDDSVQKLYKLPTNFGSFRESANWGDGVLVNGDPYKSMNGPPSPGFFSMYDDGTNKFLVLPRGLTGSASVLFNAAYATIDSTDDTVSVPDRWKFFLIWHCVSYCHVGREEDYGKMQFAAQKANEILQKALQNRNVNKKIHARSFGRLVRDYTIKDGRYIPFF